VKGKTMRLERHRFGADVTAIGDSISAARLAPASPEQGLVSQSLFNQTAAELFKSGGIPL
jgi:hypothetical protein